MPMPAGDVAVPAHRVELERSSSVSEAITRVRRRN